MKIHVVLKLLVKDINLIIFIINIYLLLSLKKLWKSYEEVTLIIHNYEIV